MVLLLSATVTLSFSPPPPDQRAIELCESSNGTVNVSYIKPDCGPGCDAAIRTVAECTCPAGEKWNATAGCVPQPQEKTSWAAQLLRALASLYGLIKSFIVM